MYKKLIVSILPLTLCSVAFAEEVPSTRLNDTVISTKGFSTTLQEESKNVAIFTDNDIKNKGFSSLSDVLANSPFVVVKAGEKGSDRSLDIRGQGKNAPSQVKIMLDSIPLNLLDTSHSQLPLNSINASQIDKVEIIPGGGSVLYGNNAIGGTVNIITKADSQKEYGYAQEMYKSYHTNDVSLGFGKAINDKFYVNFDYSNLNTQGYRFGDENKAHFVSGGITYNITNKQKLSFNTKFSQNNGITSDGISKEEIEQNRRKEGDFITDYKDTSIDYSLKYDYKINDNFEINAKAYYQQIKSDDNGLGIITILPDSEFGEWAGDYNGSMVGIFKETKTGFNLKEKFSYSSGSLVTGYDYLTNKLDRDSLVNLTIPFAPPPHNEYSLNAQNTLKKDTHSAFALLNQKIIGNLSFNAGARYEVAYFDSSIVGMMSSSFDDKRHDNNQAYSTGLSYDFNSLNKLYVSYERGYVSPSPTQLVDKDPTAGYVINDLKSQTGDNYEIGYKGYLLNSYFTLTSFYSQNNNEIVVTDFGISHDQWKYKNIDKTRRAGVEAFFEQNVSKLTFNESLSYLNTRVLEGDYKGQKIATVPSWKMVINAKYEVINKLNMGVRLNSLGRYLENNVTNVYQQTYAPSVTTVDLLVDYSPINKLYVLGGVNNVFNKKYNISQDSFGNYVVAPTANYYLGLKYEF